MADAMDVYLNDHLAGATLGSELAEQIRKRHEGSALGELMGHLAHEIEEDRQTLVDLMNRLNISQNPIKQVTGWVAEKAARLKFSGICPGESSQSTLMALESLALGVEGKAKMWQVLTQVQSQYPTLASANLEELLERATRQHASLERERLAAGSRALANTGD
jgi:hypothetical protein